MTDTDWNELQRSERHRRSEADRLRADAKRENLPSVPLPGGQGVVGSNPAAPTNT